MTITNCRYKLTEKQIYTYGEGQSAFSEYLYKYI